MDLCDNNDEDKCKFCGKGPFKSIRGHHRHSLSCGQQYMIQSQIQASQTSSMVATSPRDGRHHSQDPLAKFLKQSPAAIDFVQTVCFDADDYDNGLFLDSLVDHDAAAINGPIIQHGEINDIINPTKVRFCAQSISISSTSA